MGDPVIESSEPIGDRQNPHPDQQSDYYDCQTNPFPRNRSFRRMVRSLKVPSVHDFKVLCFARKARWVEPSSEKARRSLAKLFGLAPSRYRNVSQTSDRVVSTSPRALNRRDEEMTGPIKVTTRPAFTIRLERSKSSNRSRS